MKINPTVDRITRSASPGWTMLLIGLVVVFALISALV